jgi:hypothetical protein
LPNKFPAPASLPPSSIFAVDVIAELSVRAAVVDFVSVSFAISSLVTAAGGGRAFSGVTISVLAGDFVSLVFSGLGRGAFFVSAVPSILFACAGSPDGGRSPSAMG